MKTLKIVLMGILVLLSLTGIGYLSCFVKKTVNYNLMYKDMVKETIQENVKKECLK
jgi:flagellar basal body-associated protein FliL